MERDDARIAEAEAAEITDPRNVGQWLQGAELCLRAGMVARAERLTRRALALAPDDSKVLRVLSGILSVQARRDEALAAGSAAVRLCPGAAEPRLHLAALLAGSGAWRQAAEHLAVYLDHSAAQPSGWRLLSVVMHELGRDTQALEAIDRAIALGPGVLDYRIHRASLLGALGRHGDALADLSELAEQFPDDARVWRSRSGMHEMLHEWTESLESAERAVALDPENPGYSAHLSHVRCLLGLDTAMIPEVQSASQPSGYWTQRRPTDERGIRPQPRLAALAAVQCRIVFALMLRGMRTRFGRSRLGYLWAILEPVSHIATLGSVFSLLNHAAPPIGTHLFLFYLTGLLPFLMFSHVTSEVMTSFAANAPVLQIPVIKRTDVILARSLLQLATELVVGLLVFGGAALWGWQGMPADLSAAAAALLCLWLIGTGIGAVNIVLSDWLPSWETIFAAFVRLLYFSSGIYYSPIAMSGQVRLMLQWNPVLQCVEWFRAGFYRSYEPHWLDRGYVLVWVLGALLVGFSIERAMRRRIAVLA